MLWERRGRERERELRSWMGCSAATAGQKRKNWSWDLEKDAHGRHHVAFFSTRPACRSSTFNNLQPERIQSHCRNFGQTIRLIGHVTSFFSRYSLTEVRIPPEISWSGWVVSAPWVCFPKRGAIAPLRPCRLFDIDRSFESSWRLKSHHASLNG